MPNVMQLYYSATGNKRVPRCFSRGKVPRFRELFPNGKFFF